MTTLEDLRAKGAEMELAGVNFLNKKGEIARKYKKCTHAEFSFIDGEVLTVPRNEMDRPEFNEMQFRLRPTSADA